MRAGGFLAHVGDRVACEPGRPPARLADGTPPSARSGPDPSPPTSEASGRAPRAVRAGSARVGLASGHHRPRFLPNKLRDLDALPKRSANPTVSPNQAASLSPTRPWNVPP